jgi:3-hydroxybutyryl-CoA dehydrogenase
VPDIPGFVTARVISAIINEAYFALEEKVSSREEIDIAMKTGTNYPYGPFEWADKIGLKNVYALLDVLSRDEAGYTPASLLKESASI